MVDQLVLGGITFQNYDYAPPSRMPFGGQQALIVHKLPGGQRVIDTLGPDEDDISWSGFFLSPNAMFWCQRLDSMRGAGLVVVLTYAGMTRQVVIKSFRANIRRYPNWVEYEITCVVSNNPALGPLGTAPPVTATASGAGVGLGLVSGSTGGGGTAAGAGTGLAGGSAGGGAGGSGGGGAGGGAGGFSSADALISADLATALTAALAGGAASTA